MSNKAKACVLKKAFERQLNLYSDPMAESVRKRLRALTWRMEDLRKRVRLSLHCLVDAGVFLHLRRNAASRSEVHNHHNANGQFLSRAVEALIRLGEWQKYATEWQATTVALAEAYTSLVCATMKDRLPIELRRLIFQQLVLFDDRRELYRNRSDSGILPFCGFGPCIGTNVDSVHFNLCPNRLFAGLACNNRAPWATECSVLMGEQLYEECFDEMHTNMSNRIMMGLDLTRRTSQSFHFATGAFS